MITPYPDRASLHKTTVSGGQFAQWGTSVLSTHQVPLQEAEHVEYRVVSALALYGRWKHRSGTCSTGQPHDLSAAHLCGDQSLRIASVWRPEYLRGPSHATGGF